MAITRVDETDLLLPLHDGPHEPQPWATFLARLRQRVRADAAQLVFGVAGEETSMLAPPNATVPDNSVWRQRLRPGRVYATVARGGFGQIVRVDEAGGGAAWLSVHRAARDFTAADAALLTRLAPHLAIALRTRRALDHARAAVAISEAALARAGIAWLSFDADARVVAMSRRAAGVLGSRWNGGSGMVAAVDAVRAGRGPVLVPLRDAEQPWLLLVPGAEGERIGAPPVAAIGLLPVPRIGDPVARAGVIEALFALSPSEARLAAAILGGATLQEAAATLGLTIETARNYSKRLFAKTRTRGQVDLVRLISGSLAGLV